MKTMNESSVQIDRLVYTTKDKILRLEESASALIEMQRLAREIDLYRGLVEGEIQSLKAGRDDLMRANQSLALNCASWESRYYNLPGAIAAQDPESWTGEGLPPLGTVCEVSSRLINRTEVTIRYVGEEWVIAHDSNGERCFLIMETIFHRIPTPEQIAEEARQTAIDEMNACSPLIDKSWSRKVCEAVYDAGYRKHVE